MRKYAWLGIIPLFLFVAALGTYGLNAGAIWYDEYWSIYHAGGAHYGPISLAETWRRVASSDSIVEYGDQESNPPGYYLLLNLWGWLAGWSAVAIRALSLLLGLLAVAWMYRLGRDLISPAGGVGAVITLGASAFFIFYLHEARAYTLFILLTVMMIWCYWRGILNNHGQRTNSPVLILTQTGFVLSAAGLFYTHYLAGLTAIGLGLYHLIFAPKDHRWVRGMLLLVMAVILVLPVLPLALRVAGNASGGNTLEQFAMTPSEILETLGARFSNGLTSILLILLFWYAVRRRERGASLIWFLGISVLAGMLAFNLVFPVVTHIRYVMSLWPLLALGVGLSAAYLVHTHFKPTPIYIAWVITCLTWTFDADMAEDINAPYYYLPWPETVQILTEDAQPGDAMIFLLPDFPSRKRMHSPVADYYLHDLNIRYELTEPPELDNPGDYMLHVSDEVMGNRSRLWLGFDPEQKPDNSEPFEELVTQQLIQCITPADSDTLNLSLYARRPAQDAVGYRFGASIRLFPLGTPPTVVNGAVSVLQGWRIARTVPADTYSVALHIMDSDGNLVRQMDYPLPGSGFSCTPANVPLGELAPGEYTLVTRVYAWETGERLQISGSGNDGVVLGRFIVVSDE